jgi:DNA topoisomerase II
LTKYDKVSDILEDFYIYRLSVYELRKQYYVDFLTNQMLILKYKVKFIKLKIENKIIIEKRKKNDVLDDLEKMKFPKLSLKVRATDDQKTYNYITNMELFSLTYEKIEELNNEYNNKLTELEDYKNKTLEQLWNNELTEFLNEYNKVMKDFNKNNTKKKKKGKQGKLNKFKKKKIKINLNKNKH